MKKYRFDKTKFAKFIFGAVVGGALLTLAVDCVRFPECYFTTWKYQLEQDIKAGDEDAIRYYEERYIANGRELFDLPPTEPDVTIDRIEGNIAVVEIYHCGNIQTVNVPLADFNQPIAEGDKIPASVIDGIFTDGSDKE